MNSTSQFGLDEFYSRFTPLPNHLEKDASFNGYLFETYGNELDFIEAQNHSKVWTLIDTDEGSMIIHAGFHFINRLGYFITQQAWKSGTEQVYLN